MFHFSLAFSLSSVCYFMCNGDPGGGDLGKELDWNCEVAFNKQAEQVIWVIQFRLHCETVVFRYWSIKFVSAGFRFRLLLQNDALWVISASANTKAQILWSGDTWRNMGSRIQDSRTISHSSKNEEIDSNVYTRTQLGITERAIGIDSRKLFYKEIYIKMNAQIQSTLFKVQILKQLWKL